ncbi:MAG: copper resistance protein CopC [Gammaproteobacteria bacterium]|nr:copper resistance protein CopC [Gammaproteobacteria bacterium]
MKPCRVWLLTAVLAPGLGWAHAFLQHAAPAVGTRVSVAPTRLRLWFSERLEAAFSRVEVVDAHGRSVAAGPLHPAADPEELVIPLQQLTPGVYRVRWKAVSVDTHVTRGSFTFTVDR